MARPPHRRKSSLGEMPHRRLPCTVCGIGCGNGEPVAWSVGRGRIHESCIDVARWATGAATQYRSWKAPAMRQFLQRTGGPLCAACLAMALRISLEEAREVIRRVDGAAGLQVLPVTCGSCTRAIDALCVVPVPDRVVTAIG